jgi:hypothetical protein
MDSSSDQLDACDGGGACGRNGLQVFTAERRIESPACTGMANRLPSRSLSWIVPAVVRLTAIPRQGG